MPGALRLVVLVTTPAVAEDVVAECAAAGVPRVWLDRATGPGSMSKKAVAFCREPGNDPPARAPCGTPLTPSYWANH